jgi:ABC-2 type transport system permease protein
MAVYDHSYKQFAGPVTPRWSRFLILPRHTLRNIFQSKLFIACFVLSALYPLVASILIYLHHNVEALAIFETTVRKLVPIDAEFFQSFVVYQGMAAGFLTLLIGPPLISRDMTNNALPLYLCRPFSRAEYVLGKMSILLILLSLITWIPGLLLFLFQSYLEGWGWFTANIRIAGAIFLGSWIWILLLALMSLAISSWVKWRIAASAALIGVFFIPSAFAEVINNIFVTRWGNIISLKALIGAVWGNLFGTFVQQSGRVRQFNFDARRHLFVDLFEPPLWSAWLMVFAIGGLCLLLLARKVRAYEVVS